MPDVRSAYSDAHAFYGVTTPRVLLRDYGSPLYVYNEDMLRKRCAELRAMCAWPCFGINYSTKANANPALLRIIRDEGLVVDAMSPGELHIVLDWADFSPDQVLYVCNNVSARELAHVIKKGVLVSVDSLPQLELLGQVAPGSDVVVRLNPGIGAGHHKKVVTGGGESKFGVNLEDIPRLRRILEEYKLTLKGVNQHIGSLFMRPDAYLQAADTVLHVVETEFMGAADPRVHLELIDFGGGFGIPYHKYDEEARLDLGALGRALDERLFAFHSRTGYAGRFLVEPGRYVTAECGAVLSWVNSVKRNGEKIFVGTDIGFGVLARPMLYDSFHDVEIFRGEGDEGARETVPQTLVGNICESGDILARERALPEIRQNDAIALLDAGAYGFVMASTYNQRLRPAEVLIRSNGEPRLIRRRETFEDLTATLVPEEA